ncbi:Arrestin domain-containing protein 2 [Mortierella alpina]|nr:Arrestin domain-containing protein 2 [Mortierella alpina]
MKKLSITLLGDITEQSGHYLPGDTLGGHVNLITTASIKCNCVKIQFTGIVTTKIAKTSEDVYVLNQQVVVFGNANNATETVLGEGKHSWPFEFTIPLQRVPSSGKYRHGTVKFTLSATMISEGFMGLMMDLKASRSIPVRDLINIRLQPYSNPISVQGRSYIHPGSNDPKDLATATVHLSRSAYLKGQIMHIDIDLGHPVSISRSPGCFIQLIRKEQYFAGDQAKEYSDTIATRAEALVVNSSMNTGKILAQVVIPDDAIPSMTTTKVILVEYHLNILFDMRRRTGLFEGRHDKKVNSKMRNKLLSSPGGFQIEVPVIIGTLSDSMHTQKPSPFVQRAVTESSDTGTIRHPPLSPHSPTSEPIRGTTISHIPIIVDCDAKIYESSLVK